VTIAELHAMKGDGRKIVCVVCWDQSSAEVADDAGVEIVSVGDSVVQTFDELVAYLAGVRRGVSRALVSCDLPEPVTIERAQRLLDLGADLVKVESHAAELAAAGIPVWAQIEDADDAKRMEDAGAVLIDFRHSGPEAGATACAAVSIPVLGGLGGGPWLDGRMRVIHRLVEVSAAVREAVAVYAGDVRAGRRVSGD
jgi:3-methyl-2-oxobutanoate hydroxymethyltransferase